MPQARSVVVCLLVVLVCCSGVTFATPNTGISVTPENTTTTVGTGQQFSITIDNASQDIKGYAISVNVSNQSTAQITDIAPTREPTVVETTISRDNDSAYIEASFFTQNQTFTTSSPTIVTFDVRAVAAGNSSLTITAEEVVANTDGELYTISAPATATLSVTSIPLVLPGQTSPAQNLDSDPLLEDVNGDGRGDIFDALTYYNSRQSDVIQQNPTQFDFDGDGTTGTLFDTLSLYNSVK